MSHKLALVRIRANVLPARHAVYKNKFSTVGDLETFSVRYTKGSKEWCVFCHVMTDAEFETALTIAGPNMIVSDVSDISATQLHVENLGYSKKEGLL